jgi:hypothetical protein
VRAQANVTKVIFGFCTSGNHTWCRGAISRPGSVPPLLCACPHHDGQEVVALPADPRLDRQVVPGKRDTRLLDAWGETLRKNGTLEVDVPDDKKSQVSMRERMYTAARRQSLKVSVRVRDGKMVVTVR